MGFERSMRLKTRSGAGSVSGLSPTFGPNMGALTLPALFQGSIRTENPSRPEVLNDGGGLAGLSFRAPRSRLP